MTTTDERLTALEQRLAELTASVSLDSFNAGKLGLDKGQLALAIVKNQALQSRKRVDDRKEGLLRGGRLESLDHPVGDGRVLADADQGRSHFGKVRRFFGRLVHSLAPSSLAGTEKSVGAAPASGPSSDAGDDTTGDQR